MQIGCGCVDGSNKSQHFFFFFRWVLLFQRRKRMNSPSWNDAISSAKLVGEGKTTF
jgi:hypothetical protein